ncbi:MAG: hypothetical protein L3J32_12930 [Rhizobiaceae bacterium]|nr:hypothetical protein [Rhizobiaceae bacterium]
MHKEVNQKKRKMYLAPLDAIWPPLALMFIATTIGLVSAWFGITFLAVLAVVGFAILIGDTFGRSRDYLNARRRFGEARDEIEVYEVVRRFRRAWCARVACQAAWKRAGVKEAGKFGMATEYVKDTYFKLGYRYWHIFPDGTFTRNSPFLKIAFWVHLFTGKMKRDQKENDKPALEPAE